MSEFIPNDIVKISESGIDEPSQIIVLKQYGFKGFLIGENFMKTADPGKAAEEFIKELEKIGL